MDDFTTISKPEIRKKGLILKTVRSSSKPFQLLLDKRYSGTEKDAQ
ncbi:hypothetical protein BSUBE1_4138 [Bacillus subtilis E1]|nr:hypothetical protein BSUBE1_4138 [Bacillus subtilis E1]